MNYIYDWFKRALNYLGLLNLEAKMLFLGLDNAGKTTLLGTLGHGRVMSCLPTNKPNKDELTLGSITFTTFDLGGHKAARLLWNDYFIETDCIVFLVDAHDKERFPDAKEELDKLLGSDELSKVPFLILGNKIDLPTAASERELREALGLQFTTGKGKVTLEDHVRPIEVFMCSIVKRQGYAEGFRWLAQYISPK